MAIYWMEDRERGMIERVMKRLYTEERLDGNDMRDLAHLLNLVLDGMVKEEETEEHR
jgi:hypothetical protein